MSAQKQAIIAALRTFARQRSGMDWRDYGDAASYRSEQRAITRDLTHAMALLRQVELRDSISAADILEAAKSGRLTLKACLHGESQASRCGNCGARWCAECSPAPSAMCHKCNGGESRPMRPNEVRVDYCTGQYFPVEYRKAVARLCASVLWTWCRDQAMPYAGQNGTPDLPEGESAGDWLRAWGRREFGAAIASRYFN